MDLSPLSDDIRRRFDAKMEAREAALPASRQAIRASANAIRAVHRGEWDQAHKLMDEARGALDAGEEAAADQPDVRFGGFLQDAQKEYAEARITEVLVTGGEIPGPDELRVGPAPYLNGLAEAVGEGRRHVLDLLRHGEVDRGEAVLGAMDELYFLLASMDYPDAITMNLRRSTDIARSLIEKTRGDLTNALVQRDLKDSIERHAKEIEGGG